jgi:hypothetical protein
LRVFVFFTTANPFIQFQISHKFSLFFNFCYGCVVVSLQGNNLVQTAPEDAPTSGRYVVADSTPAPFKVAAGVKLIGFKYPNASAPNNNTFYAVAPRKPPAVLAGTAGSNAFRKHFFLKKNLLRFLINKKRFLSRNVSFHISSIKSLQ